MSDFVLKYPGSTRSTSLYYIYTRIMNNRDAAIFTTSRFIVDVLLAKMLSADVYTSKKIVMSFLHPIKNIFVSNTS